MTELIDTFFGQGAMLHLAAFLLGSVRIIVFVSFAPFLGPQLTATVMFPIVLAIYLPLHPLLLSLNIEFSLNTFSDYLDLFLLIGKEALIGYLLAYVCACLFYVALCAGTIIDNQRGASQAQEADPLAGAESSPLCTILLLAMVTLFFSSGAFMNFLAIFYSTYNLWPPTLLLPAFLYPNVSIFAIESLDFLMLNALLICAPFVLVALMCDVALGLMNRFAPQLNVFILSMPIKSGVCALLILFYLGPFFNRAGELFNYLEQSVQELSHILGG